MRRNVSLLLLVALLASGCAASRAFRRGQDAVRVADWDAAVTYFTKAVQANPDAAEYKINLRRAQEEAARMHVEKARELEAKDQLDAALTEYRRAAELVGADRLTQAKVAELERKIRERIEATRPKPPIEQLRTQARPLGAPPLLNPASREPIRMNFGASSSLRDIINFIGTASGINITYDAGFVDKPYSVNLDGVTVEEALQQVLAANQYYYKVVNPRTIIVIPDQPAKHQQYDDLVVKVFFLSHADATELNQMVNSIMRIPQMAVQPMMMPNKAANTIMVRATAPVMDVIERVIKANDKPRAEVVLDVEILEVNRNRVKRYGINLSAYALNLMFSPELAPPNTSATPGTPSASPPLFNLNTISQGVSTADFYLGVPTAVVNFLESDQHSKTLAKPQLRGAEGQKMTLNLGSEIPVISTVFGAAAAGGFATIPQSSYNYRTIGVNLDMTPRVTYEGEIILELAVENSSLGANIDVGGQSAPSFTSRKVSTHLRLREGEANLLAGLIRQDNTTSHSGLPGIMRIPGIKQLFSNNDISTQDTDIVMLITPHIVRGHDLTAEDVSSIYIGTQTNVGLSGPPPLIAPLPEALPPAAGTTPVPVPGTAGMPNAPQPGVPGPPVASPPGAQPANPPAPPGTSPVPGFIPPVTPPVTPTVTPATPAGTPPREVPPPAGTPPAGPPNPAPSAAQIIVTPAGTEFRVAGGPYAAPISINNASRISAITLTITYNPSILRVRTVLDGTFMRQGGVTASFTPRIDAANGRVDIAIARAGDQTGASGAGLLAALQLDAIAAGTSAIAVTGIANGPDGAPVTLTFAPVTVTVR
ncbi:MAG TPA: secretin and TonB N-terminal domain-containing protein [Vicinamibacterales bacterium]|nr:secretin and TonB N-terminal domain-containing protein [Vicinamibacterales bacterium]